MVYGSKSTVEVIWVGLAISHKEFPLYYYLWLCIVDIKAAANSQVLIAKSLDREIPYIHKFLKVEVSVEQQSLLFRG